MAEGFVRVRGQGWPPVCKARNHGHKGTWCIMSLSQPLVEDQGHLRCLALKQTEEEEVTQGPLGSAAALPLG